MHVMNLRPRLLHSSQTCAAQAHIRRRSLPRSDRRALPCKGSNSAGAEASVGGSAHAHLLLPSELSRAVRPRHGVSLVMALNWL